ncbi:uncharacterized protein LOC117315181 [Pecten maximus]|uniref:uncharacterized protein LOC117315181 n=1 Tax=Pecten maximus TaxID=6579 RepID=UPI001458715C|nr:uncharacterized protein LOC117315181 [Pecten maximus]
MKVLEENGNSHIGFIFGKAKVAPLHSNTIPRFELCAAVLSVEVAEHVSTHLDVTFDEIRFYTDSKVVLGYISNQTRRFYTDVSSRVERIRQFSNPKQWTYANTHANPADIATRNSPDVNLKDSIWLTGPTQLQQDVTPDIGEDHCLIDPNTDKEIRPDVWFSKIHMSRQSEPKYYEKFSSWRSLVGALSLLRCFARKFHRDSDGRNMSGTTGVQEFKDTEQFTIRSAQWKSFKEEIMCLRASDSLPKGSSILPLNPVIDKHGILRVGGRLNNSNLTLLDKNPTIIPGKSHVSKLLVRHFHDGVKHRGK